MKPFLKKIRNAIVAILILVLALALSMDFVIRKGIETAAGRSLGVDVGLKYAHLSLTRGRLTIFGMEISNPDRFKTDSLFKVGRASVAVEPRSLFAEEIDIESIVLRSPALTIEQSITGTNISKIFENLDGPAGADPAEGEPEKKYRIDSLRITDASVTFSTLLTAKAPVTVPLPDIEMKDMTSDDGTGLILAQVIRRALTGMIRPAMAEGKGIIPGEIVKDIRKSSRDLAPSLTDDALEQSKEVVEKAKEKLKGLFGK
jgi:hypothetical protein